MSSREIVLWLDERWYQALSRQLEVEKLEDKLNEYLDNLISLLPGTVYDTIIDELREEYQRRRQEMEANQIYSAFRVTKDGVTEHFRTDRVVEILNASIYVWCWLKQMEDYPFQELLPSSENISSEEYDRMAADMAPPTGPAM